MPQATNDITAAAPPTLNHVIAGGANAKVVEQIRIAVESSLVTAQPFPHTLLDAGPGLGKSLYANLVAREMGVEPTIVLGQTMRSAYEINALLIGLEERSNVLVIDEIHTLNSEGQHALLRALENAEVFLEGSVGTRRPMKVKLPPFTLIGCTTDSYALLDPLLNRFRLHLRLSPYDESEIVAVLHQRANAMGWRAGEGVFDAVAKRARHTPRTALRILEAVRRTSIAAGSEMLRMIDAERVFHLEGLDAKGLTQLDRDYLRILAEVGGAVRLNVLATRLEAPPLTLTKLVETHLVREGLIDKSDMGRELTQRGRDHLARNDSSGEAA